MSLSDDFQGLYQCDLLDDGALGPFSDLCKAFQNVQSMP